MKIILFGATGMIGQGVLRECLLDPGVSEVLAIGRSALGRQHAKLREIVRADLYDLAPLEADLTGYDACFFCLGVSSAGMGEEQYRRVTYDLTLAVAKTLARLNPAMTFIYVSGEGADSSERGRVMWARVRGKTENDLLKLPFKAAYVFRPGIIQPLHGITSRTRLYRAGYAVVGALLPLLQRVAPNALTTTEQMGRAMLAAARRGAPQSILRNPEINRL